MNRGHSHGVSRRHALQRLGSAGCLSLVGGAGAAHAQSLAAPGVSAGLTTPTIAGILTAGTPIELVNAGFLAPQGPLGLPDGSLVFTEQRANRINRVAPDGTLSVVIEDTEGAQALAYGPHGDLYAVQAQTSAQLPQVGVIFPPARRKVLADGVDGLPLAGTGDLVLSQLGHIYFTEPGRTAAVTSAGAKPTSARSAVYRLSARLGQVQRLTADLQAPRGVQLSPDERVLYVSEAAGTHVLAFDLSDDGERAGPARPFARLPEGAASHAGGLAIDVRGRLYVATEHGVQIFSDRGEAVGLIPMPRPARNLAFAGARKATLFVVGDDAVFRIATNTSGYPGRAK